MTFRRSLNTRSRFTSSKRSTSNINSLKSIRSFKLSLADWRINRCGESGGTPRIQDNNIFINLKGVNRESLKLNSKFKLLNIHSKKIEKEGF